MRARLLLSTVAIAALSACATTGSVPRPFPTPGGGERREASRTSASGALAGDAIVGTALEFRGYPYRQGGADPAGFDCSGLVRYVFAQHGVLVPRLVAQQYEVGRKVKASGIRPGDLLFFATKGRGASHVAIAIGGNRFVHAPTASGVVRVEALSSAYWGPRYVGARRLTTDN